MEIPGNIYLLFHASKLTLSQWRLGLGVFGAFRSIMGSPAHLGKKKGASGCLGYREEKEQTIVLTDISSFSLSISQFLPVPWGMY